MTRALVTGAAGFVGEHLVRHLLDLGREVVGTTYGPEPAHPAACELHPCDVAETDQVRAVFQKARPDEVYHLAAITFVPEASENPVQVLETNVTGSLNVLEAAGDRRTLLIGSAEVYGAVPEADQPVGEDQPMEPRNLYGVSKMAADLMGAQYARHKGWPVLRVRPFNHTGPGQSDPFVCSDFARQIARMEAGQLEPVLRVGNTDAVRDFCDVRDVVRAYSMIMEKAEPGAVYNICSGTGRTITQVIDALLAMSRVEVKREQDPDRLRPAEIPRMVGTHQRIRQEIGWEPKIDFETTLTDLLNYWREKTDREGPGA